MMRKTVREIMEIWRVKTANKGLKSIKEKNKMVKIYSDN